MVVLEKIEILRVKRFTLTQLKEIVFFSFLTWFFEIISFKVYCGVVYVRDETSFAKTKVAPFKNFVENFLKRLKLLGFALLSKVLKYV